MRIDVTDIDLEAMGAVGHRLHSHLVGAHVVALVVLGDRLGLFEALADRGPMSSAELAEATSLDERYVREWANALVATSYLERDDDGRYWMTNEVIFVRGDRESPGFSGGAYQLAFGASQNVPRLLDRFRTGEGIPYSEIGEDVTVGVERLWAPIHEHLLGLWLDHVPGLAERLRAGAAIVDVGCGRGRSTVSLARLFPASRVVGIDADPASVEGARALAASRGLENVEFRALPAELLAERGTYDFAYLFHALHDMGDPVAALAAIRSSLKQDGLLLCVESSASEDPMENRGTRAELFASISPLFNLPAAKSANGAALGTIVTEAAVRSFADAAGFGSYEGTEISFPPPSLLHRFHLLRP